MNWSCRLWLILGGARLKRFGKPWFSIESNRVPPLAVKPLFSIVVALFLLAYPALAESCWAATAEMAKCKIEQPACCSETANTHSATTHHHRSSSPSTDNAGACAMCTVGTSCVMIFETTFTSLAPAQRTERFGNFEEFGESRFEEPLLPPPRTVATQRVS